MSLVHISLTPVPHCKNNEVYYTCLRCNKCGRFTEYTWHGRKVLPERYGQKCRLVVCGRNRMCLVEFEDGFRVRTMTYYLRRAK